MIYTLSILGQAFDTILNIIIFLLVLSLVICIHELGHLFFAKRAGILCHEFSFGMGPKVWSTKKGETRYSIRAIPFGGYVSMAGEEIEAEVVNKGDKIGIVLDKQGHVAKIVLNHKDDRYASLIQIIVDDFDLSNEDNLHINEYPVNKKAVYVYKNSEMQIAPKNRRFNDKSKTNRFLTTFGGPLMNFVLAFVIYLVIAFSTGVANLESTVIGEVQEDAPADGVLMDGDRVISINGVDINSWDGTNASITSELEPNIDGYVFEVERNGEIITLDETVFPYLLFYGLGFAGDAADDDLIVYAPLFRNSELLPGDEILSINDQSVSSWNDLIDYQIANQEGSSDSEDLYSLSIYRELVYNYTNDTENVLPGTVQSITQEDGVYQITVLVTTIETEEEVVYQASTDLNLLVQEGDMVNEDTVLASGNLETDFLFYGEKELSAMGVSLFNSQIGISASTKFSFLGGFAKTFSLFWGAATAIFGTLGLLFTSNLVGISDLSGFVGIYSLTSEAAAYGILSLFSFVALLSVNLGILNLLPIPALDGGRIVFLGYEALTGKKPNQKFENLLHTAVFILLLALMIYVTYHDILRLFGLD